MTTTEVIRNGLEGVVAFTTEIAEPDRDGGALRYRGVDVEELVGSLPFEGVWGLLVDGRPDRPLPAAGPQPLGFRTGDTRVDVQASIAALAPAWGLAQLVDVDHETARGHLARISSATSSFVAQSARGADLAPVPRSVVDDGRTLAERFLLRWRGEADPAEATALDAYWITAAEHGMNASTFTARIVASTGADAAAALSAAVGALSGPLHGGAPAPGLAMLPAGEHGGGPRPKRAEAAPRGGGALRAPARRGARPCAVHAARGRARRRRRPIRRGAARARRAHHGLRAPGLPGGGSARPRAAPYRGATRLTAPRRRQGGRARRADGARAAPARPRAGHQRRVLVGRGARPRPRAAGALHAAVRLRPHGRLVGARPRAAPHGTPHPPQLALRRPRTPAPVRGAGRLTRPQAPDARRAG